MLLKRGKALVRVFSKEKFLRRERFIEGAEKAETRPFAEYDPLRVHPTFVIVL